MTDPTNLTALTDGELSRLRQAVANEMARRAIIASAGKEADQLAQLYQDAIGRADGDEWVQPTSAVDAYREGATVQHEGKTWVSLHSANVHAPGVSGWREVVEEGGAPAEWVAPSGAHDAYQTGDRVTFEGEGYECVLANTVWSPADYPQAWRLIDSN